MANTITAATIAAQLIASLIAANCDAHLDGRKSRDEWSTEQYRLWDLASKRRITSQVMKLVTR